VSDPYGSALLYDLEYADMDEDLSYYVMLAQRSRRVLELGCGTGRLTLPMARAGATVHGIDHSPEMLGGLELRLRAERPQVRYRVKYQQADFRTYVPQHRYPLVIWPFNALHHCDGPENVTQVLHVASQAVAPGGYLAVDCYLPDRKLYDRDPERRYEYRAFKHPVTGQRIESWEQGWWDEAGRIHHVIYVYRHPDGHEDRAHLKLRMFELPELHALIHDAGWAIVTEAGDFEGAPVGRNALKWVALLQRR
jgi:SAM-dependent methyltransferase